VTGRRGAGVLPHDVAAEVVRLYNAPRTLRVSGSLDVAEGRQIDGDVAVLDGPVTVSGRVSGRLLAINADVILTKSARIDGDLVVVGGTVEGRTDGYVGGEIRVYREVLYYREEGERIVAEEGSAADERWWVRWRNRRTRNRADITLSSAHTYNRVEGLPVYLGPTVRRDTPWGRVSVDALGILRSVDTFHWDSGNLGHRVRGEVRVGGQRGIAVGGRVYDVVDAVEPWHISDAEVGLASFFFHRDYRDYFDRHGGTGYVTLHAGAGANLTFSLSDERWGTREVRDPFTLINNGDGWRVNPRLDDARFHIANATLRVDTRNDVTNPWAGWYLVADVERGTGDVTSFGPRSAYGTLAPTPPIEVVPPPARITYTRGFLDVRRYNRIAPNASLNVRGVLGGALGGDALPLERRVSLGGPGTLPGYDFRSQLDGADVLTCSGGTGGGIPAGTPAQCDRIALAQVEYRSDLRVGFSTNDEDDEDRHWRRRFEAVGHWVLFANMGRGWLVRGVRPMDQPPDGLVYSRSGFPDLGSFRTDVGAGIDFDPIGLYVAKAVSDAKLPANFLVRVRRRF
jgi:cytoskeletal protein CcmA (bactofilin family)